jgi:hypothetical protein
MKGAIGRLLVLRRCHWGWLMGQMPLHIQAPNDRLSGANLLGDHLHCRLLK